MPQSFQNGDDNSQQNNFQNANSDDNQNSDNGVKPIISAEDLASLQKRDTNAQTHITTLETETAELKTQMESMQVKLDKAADVEDLLRQQEGNQVNLDDLTDQAAKRVTDALDAKASKAKADSNFDAVSTALTASFGDKTDEAVNKACAENDMTFDEMVELSRKNPKLALKLCKVEVKPDQQPSSTTINTSALLNNFQQQEQIPATVNVMELRTDRERVADFNRRMEAKLKELNS